jgi:hypothetical protein
VVGCCECGDEPSGSCATELVSYMENDKETHLNKKNLCVTKFCQYSGRVGKTATQFPVGHQDFFITMSILTLQHKQTPIKWLPEALSPGVE